MMCDGMDASRIVGYFKGKNILITGSTGFLGKLVVEKILRVQPDANKIYLLVRGTDAASAQQRVQQEVIDTELYGLVRAKHGDGFQQFIQEKVVALPGDITYENLGLEAPMLEELTKEIDAIVNIAATTNFYERYDVSLDVNVMGVKHLCHFAKQCRPRIKMFMHVSTAYVCGDRAGLILEKPIQPGESLREGTYLDVDAELRLVREAKETKELAGGDSPLLDARKTTTERKAMKELGLRRARHFGWSNTYTFTKAMGEMLLSQQLQEGGDMPPVVIVRPSVITSVRSDPLPGWMQGTRTIDTLIIGYAEQKLSCFLGDLGVVVDVIPGDMVVNAMMAAMVAHSEEKQGPRAVPPVYHATSSLRNSVTYAVLYESGRHHFYENPRVGKNWEIIPTREMRFFNTIERFHLYMMLTFKLPLERLRLMMVMKTPEDHMFNFNPKTIDWDDYFTRIHIPGVLKYLCK